MKIEIRRRPKLLKAKQPFYFRILGDNGEPMAQSEQYSRKIDAIDTAKLITGGRATIVDLTGDEPVVVEEAPPTFLNG